MDEEVLEAIRPICRRVTQALAYYEEGWETEKLDCLIFNVSMLHRFLLYSNAGNEILEAACCR